MIHEFMYDVFLSHNKADKPRVRRLAKRLRAAGLRVWFDEWVIQPGDDIYLAIERGLEASRTLVLCLSPAAMGSDWVALERSTVLFRGPANAARRFIPLLLADCILPETLRRYKYVDFRQETDVTFEELVSGCRADRKTNAQQELDHQAPLGSQAPRPAERTKPLAPRHTNLRTQLNNEFPTLLASVDEPALKYASSRAKKGRSCIELYDDYPTYDQLCDRLFDLHLLYLVQRQVPAMTDNRERRALLALTVKLIQQPAPSFIRHRAFLLASDLVLSVAGFRWRDHCERLRRWLDGELGASLSLGDHWLLCSLMLSGTNDEARKGSTKLSELRQSPQFGPADREHAALNIAEGLRGILLAASRMGKMAVIAEDRILAASRWIDLGYVGELESSGASQIRLLLLCADLVNVAKVCRTCDSHQTVTKDMYRLASQAIGKIDRPRIKKVARRIVQLGNNPGVAAWDLEPTYMHSDDFWEETDDHELKEVLLELFEVAHTGRDKAEYCEPGWQSWRDYYAYLGSTSANPRISKIAGAALREVPPATSGFTRPSRGTVRQVEPKERIYFPSKVEAMDKPADRERDFDAFVMSAKGETSTARFQEWAGGERVTLAIVFTDVVGSAALGEEIRDEAMNEVRRGHFAQSRKLIGQFKGREIKTIGDSFMAAFLSADKALDYAIGLQSNTGHPKVQIRAGIHIGPMQVEEGDVFGGTVNFAARVVGAIKGAEIWLSDPAKEDINRLGAQKHARLKWERHDGVAMKGFPGVSTLWSLVK